MVASGAVNGANALNQLRMANAVALKERILCVLRAGGYIEMAPVKVQNTKIVRVISLVTVAV